MAPSAKKYWFPAKKYGWGWGMPNCWQGWVVFGIWLALLLAGVVSMKAQPEYIAAYAALLAIALVVICYLKGEEPRWRWGEDDK
jgi:hypothetical protein